MGPGPRLMKKRIYRAAVWQRLRNSALNGLFLWILPTKSSTHLLFVPTEVSEIIHTHKIRQLPLHGPLNNAVYTSRLVLRPTTSIQVFFIGFPVSWKRMLRWFPNIQDVTTCFSCSPPPSDVNVNFSSTVSSTCICV